MSRRAHGQIRRGQVITTYGPGSLIDPPRHSAIVGGLDTWPKTSEVEEIVDARLTRKLQIMTGIAGAAGLLDDEPFGKPPCADSEGRLAGVARIERR